MVESSQIWDTVRDIVKSAYETYFQPLDEPMFGGYRFAYALAGALSLFGSGVVIREDRFYHITILLEYSGFSAFLIIACIPSIFFGFLISTAKTRHGPVRLYISGVLLPAFVIFVARRTWSIDVVQHAGNVN